MTIDEHLIMLARMIQAESVYASEVWHDHELRDRLIDIVDDLGDLALMLDRRDLFTQIADIAEGKLE